MPEDQSIWRCDRSIPTDTAAGRRILQEVLKQLRGQDWPRREIFAVHLAMEEALVSIKRAGADLILTYAAKELAQRSLPEESP